MKKLSCGIAAVLTAGALVAVATPAQADSVKALPLSGFSDILVDQAHSTVYVSGGALVTADLNGTVQGTVPGISAARQMTLTPDGATLVVANADGLTLVDASTRTVTRTISTGANSCPDAVTPSAGLIFFTYGDCNGASSSGLGAVDLATDTVTKNLTTGGGSISEAKLVSVPAKPNLIAAEFGDTLVLLDTSVDESGPATSVRASSTAANENFEDLALNPAGTQVITASGGTYHHQIFSTVDLTHLGDYPTAAYPNAVAVRSDGLVAAGINGIYDDDIWFFNGGSTVPVKKVNFGDGGEGSTWPEARGIAFGAKRLYAVSADTYGDNLVLRVVSTGPAAQVTIAASATTVGYNGTATITAHLLSPTTSRSLTLYATPAGKSRVVVKTANVDSSGYLRVTVKGLTRTTTFQATFVGGDDYSAGSASKKVAVRAKVTMASSSRKTGNGFHLFKANSHPVVAMQVSSPNPGGCVKVVGQALLRKKWVTFDSASCLKLNSSSLAGAKLVGSYPAGTKVRVGAVFTGSAANAASAQTWYYISFTKK